MESFLSLVFLDSQHVLVMTYTMIKNNSPALLGGAPHLRALPHHNRYDEGTRFAG